MAAPKSWPQRTVDFSHNLVGFIIPIGLSPDRAADIVDRHVDLAELIGNRPVQFGRSLAFLEVEDGGVDIAAIVPQAIDRSLRCVSRSVGNDHDRAFLGHTPGCG